MTRRWNATATPTAPGWMVLPAGAGDQELRAWVGAMHDELREQWGDAWQKDQSAGVREILEAAVASRSGVVLDALCWPFSLPAVARVTVQVGPSTPLTFWSDAGYELDSYNGASLGPGVQCIRTEVLEGGEEPVTISAASYVFDDGDRMVLVELAPTFFQVFAKMLPGLQGLVDSLELVDDRGNRFAAAPIAGFPHGDFEEWEMEVSG